MLEIVAKRAALRPADTIVGQSNNDLESEVSHKSMIIYLHRFCRQNYGLVLQFLFLYACVIYYAMSMTSKWDWWGNFVFTKNKILYLLLLVILILAWIFNAQYFIFIIVFFFLHILKQF